MRAETISSGAFLCLLELFSLFIGGGGLLRWRSQEAEGIFALNFETRCHGNSRGRERGGHGACGA